MKAFGGPVAVCALLVGYIILQSFDIATNNWLANWSNAEAAASRPATENERANSTASSLTTENSTAGTSSDGTVDSQFYLAIYALLSIIYVAWNPIVLVSFMKGGLRASKVQHAELLSSVMAAPMSWFETTPVGRGEYNDHSFHLPINAEF
jgi:hypothetical protein|eukprot:COSAG01_NODE_7352_length_3240_cov_13.469003_2_plen_151_part_00